MLGGKRLSAEESEALWEEMETSFNTIVGDAAKVDADQPWTAPNAEALDRRTLARLDRWARARHRSARPACTP